MATKAEIEESSNATKAAPTIQVPKPTTPTPRAGSSSSAESGERLELGILFKFIKPFDGNRETLNSFISNCQNAYSLATKPQRPILFKYILSQLEGKAEITCSIKDFESFEQFIEFMKNYFGERKHYAHLLSELQDCRQNYSESVNQFALRIETCLAKLLTEVNISVSTKRKKSELTGRVAAMEDLALHTFLVGLNPRLAQIVRCRDPETLNAAISFAVAEEKILHSLQRKAPTNNTNDRPRPPQFKPNESRPNICRYCKNIGHTIENCRKRQYNNNRYKPQREFNNTHPPLVRHTDQPGPSAPRKIFTIDNEQGIDETDKFDDLNE